jgi:hypothetical protein
MRQSAEMRRTPRAEEEASSFPEAGAPAPPIASRPLSGPVALQIVMVWRGRILGYRLLRRRGRVTIGPHKRSTLVTPAVLGGRGRFKLAQPKGEGYLVRLTPGMRGDVNVNGLLTSVAEVLASPAPPKSRKPSHVREVMIGAGDRARITLGEESDLRIELRFVETPETIGRPRIEDPLLAQTITGATIVLGLLAALATMLWNREPPRTLAISAERLVKLAAPIELEKVAAHQRAAKKEEEKKKDEGQMKRAKEKTGKVGQKDAKPKETVIPKGDKDVLREKVSKVGLLGLIGKEKPQGSGLSKLFAESNDVEQAVAGMAGAKLVAGHGSGGLATSGTAAGGGGTGYGHIYGSGNLDTGGRGSKGHGRGPKLADRGEKEVKVSMGIGSGDSDGSLSREQVLKVVNAHKAGLNYCYEKELQRKTTLAGTISIFWMILPDGSVQKANVQNTTMGDPAVEGCILRQVKQWVFPKAPGQTHVNFPFIFRGAT